MSTKYKLAPGDDLESPKIKNFEKYALVRPEKNDKRICRYIDTKTNKRCQMKLGNYPKFCQLHSLSIDNLYVDTSNIDGAGYGLFAGPFGFKQGDRIGEYSLDEIRVKPNAIDRRSHNPDYSYVFCDHENIDCWDALDYRTTIVRYANDARNSQFKNNSYFDEKKRNGKTRVYLVASKRIEPLEEIFVSYGEEYWDQK
jgi:hypothetical protein